ncbi:MAG: hypothetical protein GXY20_10115 [Clostridiales bacterium]|jgi:hypothetical protein|nr:hypothetical protein [Clostridiales bacterium]
MNNTIKLLFKISAAILIIASAAVAVYVFRNEIIRFLKDAKEKVKSMNCCCQADDFDEFEDFEDV